jgi:hypothetical protein
MLERITLTCGRDERERAGNPALPRASTGYDKRKTASGIHRCDRAGLKDLSCNNLLLFAAPSVVCF